MRSSWLPVAPTLAGIGVVATLLSLLLADQLVAVPCVAAAGLLGFSIARWMERRGASRAACIATIAFAMVNPLTLEALVLGHPEELLGGALCVGAVLAALRQHSIRAGLLLGLALTVPLVTGGLSPTHAPVVAIALPLAVAWWFSARRTPDDALALLALLFLLRCLLDPVDSAYQHVPLVLSLMAWEGLVRRGLPFVSILSSVAIYFAVHQGDGFYLVTTLPVAAWLATRLYLPRRSARRSGGRAPLMAAGPFR